MTRLGLDAAGAGGPRPALHDLILRALDGAIVASEWAVADDLLRAMEDLCDRDRQDARLIAAYRRLTSCRSDQQGR